MAVGQSSQIIRDRLKSVKKDPGGLMKGDEYSILWVSELWVSEFALLRLENSARRSSLAII